MSEKYLSTKLDSQKALSKIRDASLPEDLLEVEININDKRIRPFLKYQLIYEHLHKALEFLNVSKMLGGIKKSNNQVAEIEGKNPSAVHALTIGAVIMYCKHFTKSKGPLRSSPLQSNTYFRSNPDLEKYHHKIVNMRNEFIAHSGYSEHDSIHAFLTFDSTSITSLEAEYIFKYAFDLDEIKKFKRLIKYVMHDIGLQIAISRDNFIEELSETELNIFIEEATNLKKARKLR